MVTRRVTWAAGVGWLLLCVILTVLISRERLGWIPELLVPCIVGWFLAWCVISSWWASSPDFWVSRITRLLGVLALDGLLVNVAYLLDLSIAAFNANEPRSFRFFIDDNPGMVAACLGGGTIGAYLACRVGYWIRRLFRRPASPLCRESGPSVVARRGAALLKHLPFWGGFLAVILLVICEFSPCANVREQLLALGFAISIAFADAGITVVPWLSFLGTSRHFWTCALLSTHFPLAVFALFGAAGEGWRAGELDESWCYALGASVIFLALSLWCLMWRSGVRDSVVPPASATRDSRSGPHGAGSQGFGSRLLAIPGTVLLQLARAANAAVLLWLTVWLIWHASFLRFPGGAARHQRVLEGFLEATADGSTRTLAGELGFDNETDVIRWFLPGHPLPKSLEPFTQASISTIGLLPSEIRASVNLDDLIREAEGWNPPATSDPDESRLLACLPSLTPEERKGLVCRMAWKASWFPHAGEWLQPRREQLDRELPYYSSPEGVSALISDGVISVDSGRRGNLNSESAWNHAVCRHAQRMSLLCLVVSLNDIGEGRPDPVAGRIRLIGSCIDPPPEWMPLSARDALMEVQLWLAIQLERHLPPDSALRGFAREVIEARADDQLLQENSLQRAARAEVLFLLGNVPVEFMPIWNRGLAGYSSHRLPAEADLSLGLAGMLDWKAAGRFSGQQLLEKLQSFRAAGSPDQLVATANRIFKARGRLVATQTPSKRWNELLGPPQKVHLALWQDIGFQGRFLDAQILRQVAIMTLAREGLVAIQLERHRADSGGLPQSLDEIRSSIRPDDLIDPYSGSPFWYWTDGQDWQITSAGNSQAMKRGRVIFSRRIEYSPLSANDRGFLLELESAVAARTAGDSEKRVNRLLRPLTGVD